MAGVSGVQVSSLPAALKVAALAAMRCDGGAVTEAVSAIGQQSWDGTTLEGALSRAQELTFQLSYESGPARERVYRELIEKILIALLLVDSDACYHLAVKAVMQTPPTCRSFANYLAIAINAAHRLGMTAEAELHTGALLWFAELPDDKFPEPRFIEFTFWPLSAWLDLLSKNHSASALRGLQLYLRNPVPFLEADKILAIRAAVQEAEGRGR